MLVESLTMEEKERYKLESYNEAFCQIYDTESNEWYLRKDLVEELLNQQDKLIKELEAENEKLKKKLAITEKALELACDKIADMLTQNGGAWFYDFNGDTVIERDGFEDFYKRYAFERISKVGG